MGGDTRTKTACSVAALILAMAAPAIGTLTDGLVLYYSFDTNTGSVVHDQSGNMHTGTVNGATHTSTGRIGGAYVHDGINDHILAGNLGTLPQGTISFWMYAEAIENYRNPFSTDYASGDDCIRFEISTPSDLVVGMGPSAGGAFFTHGLQARTWCLVTFAWTGTEYRGWLNGEPVFSGTHDNQMYLNFNNVAIGNGYSTSPSRYWRGMVDEVRIYNRVLSTQEVSSLYDAAGPGPEEPDPPQSDLVLYYSFDTNTGSTVYDESGNGHVGLVYGATHTTNGRVGGAYRYDGINDHVLAGSLGRQTQGTLSFWMYADSVENWRNPFSTDYASWDDCIRFEADAARNFVVGLGPLAGGALYTTNLQPRIWYYVTFAWTESDYWGWLNGHPVFHGTHNNQMYLDFNNVAVGNGYSTAPDRYWKGMVDEVRVYNRVLTTQEVASLYAEAGPEPEPGPEPPPGGDLVLYYSFDTNTGSIVYDQSGNGHDGIVYGPTHTEDGRLGGAYQFDGVNDHILAGHLGYMAQGTILFWMNADQVENWRNPFSTDYASWDDCIRFEEGASGEFVVGLGPQAGGAFYTSNLQSRAWHHVTFAWTENSYWGWLNGQLVFSGTHGNQMYLDFNNVAVGNGYSTSPDRYWKGLVDEVRIYNRVLLQSEISALAEAGSGGIDGWLTVNIEPEDARTADARWRLASDAPTEWYESGFSRSLPGGNHEVVFKPLGGWETPPNAAVTVTAGRNSFLTGFYVLNTVDTTPPVIMSIYPPDGYVSLGNHIPMVVVVTDNVAVASVRFNHSNAVEIGPTNTFLYTRHGVRGSFNPVTIVARDTCGNAITQTINYAQACDLQLSALWDGYWRVRNPFDSGIDYTWDVVGSEESGAGTVPAHSDDFFTTTLGPKTVRLYTNGVLVDTRNSSKVHPDQGAASHLSEIDSDGDGMSNGEEEVAGTDPDSEHSYFSLETDAELSAPESVSARTLMDAEPGEDIPSYMVFSWPSGIDSTYTVETSTNLWTWKIVTGAINLPGTGGIMSYTNRTDDLRFYLRIRAQKLQ